MSKDCLFCKIIAGEIPSTEVYRDDEVFAFEDINPAAPTHILVIPIKCMKDITAATEEDKNTLGKMLLIANQIADERGLTKDGFRYVINTGRDGCQTVFHLDLHIIGGRSMSWPPG